MAKRAREDPEPKPLNVMGPYGEWAAAMIGGNGAAVQGSPPLLSYRNAAFQAGMEGAMCWRARAKAKLREALLPPDLEPIRKAAAASVSVERVSNHDGVRIEEVSWRLPHGPRTCAVFLRPAAWAEGDPPLPGVLALHCHGGIKSFGFAKIARTDQAPDPRMASHQKLYYSGRARGHRPKHSPRSWDLSWRRPPARWPLDLCPAFDLSRCSGAWANELARRGYAVLAHDVFPFGSRCVRRSDVAVSIRDACAPLELQVEARESVAARRAAAAAAGADQAVYTDAEYNRWASEHEHVLSKSLLSAGVSWPGVLLAEDIAALDVLCTRECVDASRVGCGGLSGGGLRTMLLGSLDERVSCAVQVGYFTTSRDMALNVSFGHSWQGIIAGLARWLDMADVPTLRVPLPTMVQHARGDALFTSAEAERGLREAGEAFRKAGATTSWAAECVEGPHQFSAEMQSRAFAFFDRWLRLHGDGNGSSASGSGGDCDGGELAALRESMSRADATTRLATRASLQRELDALEERRAQLQLQLQLVECSSLHASTSRESAS